MKYVLVTVLLACSCAVLADEWGKLPALPDREGFAGLFAGLSHHALIVAGGANFPDKKPWQGGKKVWYDDVYVLPDAGGKWLHAGKLPGPRGYGCSVTYRDGVICVGGSDSTQHYAEAYRLEWKSTKLITTNLLALPKPIANMCGALVGETLYIAGGQETPDSMPTSEVYRLDLKASPMTWQRIEDCPGGGRMLSVAASCDGAFWVMGGVSLIASNSGKKERRYLTDAYRFDPAHGWKRIADLPRPATAAPSPAPSHQTSIYLLGGDDGTQVGVDPDRHRGFQRTILRYDIRTNQWTSRESKVMSSVTVPCVPRAHDWVIPSGEIRPGIRTPDVVTFNPQSKD